MSLAYGISDTITRIAVDVTFLRLDGSVGIETMPAMPDEITMVTCDRPSVGYYRYLYNSVGAPYCWWLRRMAPDSEIAALMADPAISIHVAMQNGEPAGFFELDRRGASDVNIGYFGLLPHAVGTGIGPALLAEAIRTARLRSASGAVRVNTCTADHPRALPTYLRAGFKPLRTVREVWDIPDRLGLVIPDRLRA